MMNKKRLAEIEERLSVTGTDADLHAHAHEDLLDLVAEVLRLHGALQECKVLVSAYNGGKYGLVDYLRRVLDAVEDDGVSI